MKTIVVLMKLVCLLFICFNTATATAVVNVFACEPEWESLAEELGGNLVRVNSATTALQDPHHIEGWLPLLIRQSGNSAIQESALGYFMASEFVERLEIPTKLDRSQGDVHAAGNPHVHLDPYKLLIIAEKLSDRLQGIDPKNRSLYKDNFADFKLRWQSAIIDWEAKAASLQGKKAVVYHKNWTYLLDWLGIDAIADLEPKPGLPPTSKHLAGLLKKMNAQSVDFILYAAYQPSRSARWLSKRSNVAATELPFTVGGNAKAKNLFSLMDDTINTLLAAVNSSPK